MRDHVDDATEGGLLVRAVLHGAHGDAPLLEHEVQVGRHLLGLQQAQSAESRT